MIKLPEGVRLSLAKDPELLAHAKLYVFADRFNILALKTLAWKNLECELVEAIAPVIKNFKGYQSNTEPARRKRKICEALAKDLIDLISYCCENLLCVGDLQDKILRIVTQLRDGSVSKSLLPAHPLLDYIAKYCAWQWDLLQHHEAFIMFIFDLDTKIKFRTVFTNLLPTNVRPNRANYSPREL